MRPLESCSLHLLAAALVLAAGACASRGLVIDAPAVAPLPPGVEDRRVRIGHVVDARVFSSQSVAAPIPSTRGDADDADWTRRVFGRRRSGPSSLGADRFTADPAGVPALVRASIAAGLSRATPPVAVVDDPAAPSLDVVIERFWIRPAMRSSNARLIYEAEVRVSGRLEGLAEPVTLRAAGSILSGAESGVLWRNAMHRTLEGLAEEMTDAVASSSPE